MEFISDALGHSDMKTTKGYLAGFEEETIHETTNALTAFAKKEIKFSTNSDHEAI